MSNYPKARGTQAESVIVKYLHDVTGADVLRRVQHGGSDRGDVHIPGVPVMVESKNTKRCNLPRWRLEVVRQMFNASCDYGALIWSPPGLGSKSVDRWLAIDWPDTAIDWTTRGALGYVGPLTKLATVAAQYPNDALLIRTENEPDARVRHFSHFAADLSGLVATLA